MVAIRMTVATRDIMASGPFLSWAFTVASPSADSKFRLANVADGFAGVPMVLFVAVVFIVFWGSDSILLGSRVGCGYMH